jgi:hypothetical protein
MDHPGAPPKDALDLRPAVNCPACHRLFNVPAGKGEGDLLTCPFCATRMVLRIRQVLVAEPVEAA